MGLLRDNKNFYKCDQKFPEDPTHTKIRRFVRTIEGNPKDDAEIAEDDTLQELGHIKVKKSKVRVGLHEAIRKFLVTISCDYLKQLTVGYFPKDWKRDKLVTVLKETGNR